MGRWSTPLTPTGRRVSLLHQENIHSPSFPGSTYNKALKEKEWVSYTKKISTLPHSLAAHITKHQKKICLRANTIIFQHCFFHVSVSPFQSQPTQMFSKDQFWIPINDLLVYSTIYNLFIQFWLANVYVSCRIWMKNLWCDYNFIVMFNY